MKKKLEFLLCFLIIISVLSCKDEVKETKKVNFYHWKINADLEEHEKEALKIGDYGEKPISVIRKVDKDLKDKEIVPVIFISNAIFQTKYFYKDQLVRKIFKLTEQIHKHHFNTLPQEIQIDCDSKYKG